MPMIGLYRFVDHVIKGQRARQLPPPLRNLDRFVDFVPGAAGYTTL